MLPPRCIHNPTKAHAQGEGQDERDHCPAAEQEQRDVAGPPIGMATDLGPLLAASEKKLHQTIHLPALQKAKESQLYFQYRRLASHRMQA